MKLLGPNLLFLDDAYRGQPRSKGLGDGSGMLERGARDLFLTAAARSTSAAIDGISVGGALLLGG